jgi:hypothetical protein
LVYTAARQLWIPKLLNWHAYENEEECYTYNPSDDEGADSISPFLEVRESENAVATHQVNMLA